MQVNIQNINTGLVIITGIMVFLITLLLFFIILHRKSHNLFLQEKELMQIRFDQLSIQARLETQEETLSLLSKELHDNVGQLLNSSKLLIGVTQRSMSDPPATLNMAGDTIGEAIQELRSLSKSLNKEWLEQFHVLENLQAEIHRINASNTVHVSLQSTDALSLQSDEQIILFRIVQEIIQNALKHAAAREIGIIIQENTSHIKIEIADDGNGFDQASVPQGMGTLNIKQRTQMLGGTVQWHSAQGAGTKVIVQLPVKQEWTSK